MFPLIKLHIYIYRLCEVEQDRANIPKYSISAPCLFIKDVKWSFKEAIGAFGHLVSHAEKSKVSKMLKKYPLESAKALLLEGHCEF